MDNEYTPLLTTALGYTDRSPISKYASIIESPHDKSGPLTFGIELEFLLPVLLWGLEDPHPSDARPPITATNHNDAYFQLQRYLGASCGFPFRLSTDDVYYPPYHNVSRYDQWRIAIDSSIQIERPFELMYYWFGAEVTSEIMRSNNPAFYIRRITDVCRALRNTRVHVNQSTAVHVHIGRGDQSFSLLTIKKFATLIFFVDEMLLSLNHPAHRNNAFRMPLTQILHASQPPSDTVHTGNGHISEEQELQMSEFLPTNLGPGTAPMQFKLDTALLGGGEHSETSSYAVLSGFSQNAVGRGSVGFTRFTPAGSVGGNTHTFEFRQMNNSLDPVSIIHWVRVCIAITDFARLSSPEQYKQLIEKISDKDVDFSAFDLLIELGLVEEEKYFRSKVEAYESGNLEFYSGQSSGKPFLEPLR